MGVEGEIDGFHHASPIYDVPTVKNEAIII